MLPRSLEAPQGAWPALPPGGALRIEVLAGFGPEWTDVPADLRQAVSAGVLTAEDAEAITA